MELVFETRLLTVMPGGDTQEKMKKKWMKEKMKKKWMKEKRKSSKLFGSRTEVWGTQREEKFTNNNLLAFTHSPLYSK